MVNRARIKAYTRVARWYNLAYLVFITIGSIGYLIFTISGVYKVHGIDTSSEEIFRLVLVGIVGTIAILGIFQEKLWAKWFAIAIYGLYIFSAVEGMVGSFSLGHAYALFMSNTTIILMRIWRLTIIIASLVGIALLLKKPRLGNNVEERE